MKLQVGTYEVYNSKHLKAVDKMTISIKVDINSIRIPAQCASRTTTISSKDYMETMAQASTNGESIKRCRRSRCQQNSTEIISQDFY
ncbi:hypothetical protein CHS0354_004374 [Potamilus streckersoni]|uniref:Uncharacterized protein n=1 Tax=Potamilus streckersoni TaxID=2493646 RepID=A0AAE0SZR2_9BIVA|nr:hypothetical protein CHS0354_004374 [Potamilus streckersoni]